MRVPGATSYEIERSLLRFGTWQAVGTTTEKTFLHENLAPYGFYTYRLRARNDSGTSNWSANFSGRTLMDFEATQVTTNSVALSWTAIPGGTAYKLDYNEVGSAQVTKLTLTPDLNMIVITSGVVPATSFEFKLRGFDSNGLETPIRTLKINTPPDAPISLAAEFQIPSTVFLSWPVDPAVQSYQLERLMTDASPLWVPLGSGNGSFTDTTIELGRNYLYRISATTNFATSEFTESNPANTDFLIPDAPTVTEIGAGTIELQMPDYPHGDWLILERRIDRSRERFEVIGEIISGGGTRKSVDVFDVPLQYRVRAKFGDQSTPASPVVSVTALRALDLWRLDHFGSTSPGGIAAEWADPDLDGWPNVVEFLYQTDPREAQSTPTFSLELVEQEGVSYQKLVLAIPPISLNSGVTMLPMLRGSSDLKTFLPFLTEELEPSFPNTIIDAENSSLLIPTAQYPQFYFRFSPN